MTDLSPADHPITPPPELVELWECTAYDAAPIPYIHHIARCAARWGADQELEACCEWLEDADLDDSQKVSWVNLRAVRRPKPPSLKEQALETLRQMHIDPETGVSPTALDTIRRALEQLDDH